MITNYVVCTVSFILVSGNARPDTAGQVTDYLNALKIPLME